MTRANVTLRLALAVQRAMESQPALTTHHYVEADLAMKDRALDKLHEPDAKIQRYRAPDSLLDLLKTLRL